MYQLEGSHKIGFGSDNGLPIVNMAGVPQV